MQISKLFFFILCNAVLIACHPPGNSKIADAKDSLPSQITRPDSIHYATAAELDVKHAQSIYKNFFSPGETAYVVSTEEIQLHNEPDSTSEVLLSLNFKDSVTIIAHPFSIDEILSMRTKSTDSFWVKVKYREREGYVLSNELIFSKIENNNLPVHLFLTHGGCINNYAYNPNFKYYGLFKNANANTLQSIQLTFSGIHDAWEGLAWDAYDIRVRGDEKTEPLFIFGLNKILKEGEIKEVNVLPSEDESEKRTTIDNETILVGTRHNERIHLTFKSSTGKEIQMLDIFYLRWSGDLDDDGKIDFVYAKGDGEQGGIYIALSSFAGKGEVVKELAFFRIGLCC
jgi:hypothetical protein